MRAYIRELEHKNRAFLFKYIMFKVLMALLVFSYLYYISRFVSSGVWHSCFELILLARDFIVFTLVIMAYIFVIVCLFVVGSPSEMTAYAISISFVSSIIRVDASRLYSLSRGIIQFTLIDLVAGGLAILLIVAFILNLSFIVRGSIAHFMWAVALSLFTLTGLVAIGVAQMRVYPWPPHSLGEVIFNSFVILAAFTFLVIEVCGNLAYAADVIDRYRTKINRVRKTVESLFYGRTMGIEVEQSSRETEGSALRLSPLAEILLRGYSGIYALEETTEELSGKVLGFLKLEEKRDRELIGSLLGVRASPHFERMILSIILNLFFKLPLCVILALATLGLASVTSQIYPGVVEAQSPSFIVLIFTFVSVIFYYLGLIISQRQRR